MAKPSDQIPAGSNSPTKEELPLRKMTMIDPGFRDMIEPSVLRPRILGLKAPTNPNDRKNIKFLGIALAVALLIFGILEFKQLCEAIFEAKK